MEEKTDTYVESSVLVKLQTKLKEYEDVHKFSSLRVNDIEEYLSYDKTSLAKMTDVMAGEAAAMLAQYAFYLQKLSNDENTVCKWAEENVQRIIGPKLPQYRQSYRTYDEMKLLAIYDNDVAKQFEMLRIKAETRVNKLAYLSSRVQFMAQTLIELQKTKRRGYRD